jgi:hypothetical protein
MTAVRRHRSRLFHWSCVLLTAAVLTGFAFLLLTGRYSNDGPVVVQVSSEHGLHAGDLFVMAGWALGMLALAFVALAPDRRPSA